MAMLREPSLFLLIGGYRWVSEVERAWQATFKTAYWGKLSLTFGGGLRRCCQGSFEGLGLARTTGFRAMAWVAYKPLAVFAFLSAKLSQGDRISTIGESSPMLGWWVRFERPALLHQFFHLSRGVRFLVFWSPRAAAIFALGDRRWFFRCVLLVHQLGAHQAGDQRFLGCW